VSVINDCAAPEFWVMEKMGKENQRYCQQNMATDSTTLADETAQLQRHQNQSHASEDSR